jgi:asparaginyl-tRNA synthetase
MRSLKRTQLKFIFDTPDEYAGKTVQVCGWLRSLRDSKAIAFAQIHDGSCFGSLQVVLDAALLGEESFVQSKKWGVGASVRIAGELVLTPEAKQSFELRAVSAALMGESPPDYPLQKKRHSLEFLREMQHLRPRTNTIGAALRIRSAAALAIHSFFNQRGFTYVHTPIITTADAEGAGEMFRVTTLDMQNSPKTKEGTTDWSQDFFGKPAYLTVSGQLQGEAMAMAFGNIYTFGPTFRAERSFTARHAAEFWMVEPEIAFADLTDAMDLAQDLLTFVIRSVLASCAEEISFFDQFVDPGRKALLEQVCHADFARITYTEAIEKLLPHNDSFQYKVDWGSDLQTEHERFLTEKLFGGAVFVTDYPKNIKAFYMRQNDDGKTVAAMDLLVPGVGEIIGGSQREERAKNLTDRCIELGLHPEAYQWYIDLRRFGGCPHAGFGLGFERLVMYLTGMANIRDVLPFPRTAGSAAF